MAKKSLEYLKSKYKNGDIPTQEDFEDFLDTTYQYLGLENPPQLLYNATADGATKVVFDISYGDITNLFNIGDVIISIDGPSPGMEGTIIGIYYREAGYTDIVISGAIFGGYSQVLIADITTGSIIVSSRLGVGVTDPNYRIDSIGEINIRNTNGYIMRYDDDIIIQHGWGITFYGKTNGKSSFGNVSGSGSGCAIVVDSTDIDNPTIEINTAWSETMLEVDKSGTTISNVLNIIPQASAPSSPSEGDIYTNSTDKHIYCYMDSSWKQLDN